MCLFLVLGPLPFAVLIARGQFGFNRGDLDPEPRETYGKLKAVVLLTLIL